jgi:hypothetical protein
MIFMMFIMLYQYQSTTKLNTLQLISISRGWTRVLYSTKVKLFPWIPNFVVTFITTRALVEVRNSRIWQLYNYSTLFESVIRITVLLIITSYC